MWFKGLKKTSNYLREIKKLCFCSFVFLTSVERKGEEEKKKIAYENYFKKR